MPAFHDRLWELILDNYDKLVKKDKRTREQRKEKIQEDWEESFPLPFFRQKDKKDKKGEGEGEADADADDDDAVGGADGEKTSSPLTVIPLADHETFKTVFTDPNMKPLQNASGKPMKFDEITSKLAGRMIDVVPVVSYSRIEVGGSKYQTLRQSAVSAMIIDVNEGGGGMQQSQQTETSARFRTKYGDSQGAFLQECVSKLEAKSVDEDNGGGGGGGGDATGAKRKFGGGGAVKHNTDLANSDDDNGDDGDGDDGGGQSSSSSPRKKSKPDAPPSKKGGKASDEPEEEPSLPAATPSINTVNFSGGGLGMPKRRRA